MKQHDAEVTAISGKIESIKENLQSQKVRFQTAIQVANQAIRSGSDTDIASVYKQLNESLTELCDEERLHVTEDVRLSQFKSNSKMMNITKIGDLMPCEASSVKDKVDKVSDGSWELACTFGDEGDAKLSNPCGISTTPGGDLVVANYLSNVPVKVYDCNGKYKFSVDKQSCDAWDVAVSRTEGKIYATCDKHVRVFQADGRYVSQFAAVSPSGVASDTEGALLIDNKDQLLVGEWQNKYISIHDLNGTHIRSFHVTITPMFITTTSQGNIVVSPFYYGDVHVLDSNGNLQHTIRAPPCVSEWRPAGVCCSINDEICIGNYGKPSGIYCFSSTGKYLRCITLDVSSVHGITLLEKDNKMAVINNYDHRVRLFRKK